MKTLFLMLVLLVPLGNEMPKNIRSELGKDALGQDLRGPYWLVFLKPACLNTNNLQTLFKNIANTKTPTLFAATETMPHLPGPTLQPNQALDLAMQLKVHALPTTLLIGPDDRIRDVIEGQTDPVRLQTALKLVQPKP